MLPVSTPADRRRSDMPPPQLAERVNDRSFIDSAPFLDGGERRSFVRHVIEPLHSTTKEQERRGHRDRPVEGVDRSDTSYVDAYAEAGYTPMPLDPSQISQLHSDVARLNVPNIVDESTMRSRNLDTGAFDRAAAAAAVSAAERRAAHIQIERALRAAEQQSSLFSLDYARAVPDALIDTFLASKELQAIVSELAPLFVLPEETRPHTTLAYMQRLLGGAGCKFVESKRVILVGAMRDHISSDSDEDLLYTTLGAYDSEHAHYDASSNSTTLVIATFCCIGLYIDAAATTTNVTTINKDDDNNDDEDDDDDDTSNDDFDTTMGVQGEEATPSTNDESDSQFYRVDLVFHLVAASDEQQTSNGDVLCLRTFRFHARR